MEGGYGREPEADSFLEESIMERIDQILHEDLKGTKTFYEEQEKIMEGLDQEIKDKFEDFASNMICISARNAWRSIKRHSWMGYGLDTGRSGKTGNG